MELVNVNTEMPKSRLKQKEFLLLPLHDESRQTSPPPKSGCVKHMRIHCQKSLALHLYLYFIHFMHLHVNIPLLRCYDFEENDVIDANLNTFS